MIVRIVRMTFKEDKVEEFLDIFHHAKRKIREFRGCIFLELLRDSEDPNSFMTYSVWSSEKDLNRYRESELFRETWGNVKVFFSKDPEAKTMIRVEKV